MKTINSDGGVEMNELSKKFVDINNGATVVLEKNKIYDVRQDDSFEFEGYYCSNTAKKHENIYWKYRLKSVNDRERNNEKTDQVNIRQHLQRPFGSIHQRSQHCKKHQTEQKIKAISPFRSHRHRRFQGLYRLRPWRR